MRSRFLRVIKAIAVIVFASFASAAALIAAPPGSQYTPGETLAPTCAPGDPNCSVVPPAASGANADITSMTALTQVGIGGVPSNTFDVAKQNTIIANAEYTMSNFAFTVLPAGNQDSGATNSAITANTTVEGANTGTVGEIHGIRSTASNAGTGAIAGMVGLQASVSNSGATTVGDLWGIWVPGVISAGTATSHRGIVVDNDVSGGVVTDLTGLYLSNDISGGTVTNRYGLRITAGVGTPSTGDFGIYQESSTQLNYLAGKLGIGTTAPVELLDARGADADIDLTTFNNTNSDNSTLHLKFARGTQSVPAVVVDGDTIGELKGELYNGTSYSTATNINFSADCVIGADKCGAISLRTRAAGGSQPLTRMKIKSNGFIGIGTSTPDDALVEVKGGTVCVDTNSDNLATSCITTESDIRLKKNIQPIEGALDKIMQINGVTFDWRWDEFEQISRYEAKPHDIGVIAQEVETVFPEALGEDINGYKTVDYRLLVAPLIESVKELKQENDQLKALLCLDHPDAVICQ